MISVSTELSFFVGHSMIEMESLKQSGLISDRLYRHYCFLWLWSAWRTDYRHDVFYKKFGAIRYSRRIERVNAILQRIKPLREQVAPETVPFALGVLNR